MVKKYDGWMPLVSLVAAFCIIALTIVFVIRQTTSPLVTVTQWIGDTMEGFQTVPKTSPRCPTGYTFFTDTTGESLCCNGSVNPLTHSCKVNPTRSDDKYGGLCAFRPDVPNPKIPSISLPLCSGVIEAVTKSNGTNICPPSLPNYAESTDSSGTLRQSCCKTATNLDGTDCVSTDLDANTFCRVNPTPTFLGRSCAQLRLFETSGNCPTGLTKGMYTMGAKEVKAYPDASGVVVPICYGVTQSCFPDAVISTLQNEQVFTSQPSDPKQWGYACSGYQKYYVDKDMSSPQVTTTYLD